MRSSVVLLAYILCTQAFLIFPPNRRYNFKCKNLNPDELSEDQLEEIYSIALGEEHNTQLSKKVEESMQEDWDVRQGVVGYRRKPLPLKANIDLWSYYAKQEFLKGNFTSASEWYKKCIDYNPVDGRAWLGLGRVQLKRGNTYLAEKSFKDGLYYNPGNPFILQAYAVMLDKGGKTQQAIRLLTSAIKASPKHIASWVELGRIHQKLGRVEEARFCFRSAVEADTKSYFALQAWGVLEADVGNIEEARRLFGLASDKANKGSVHALQAWASLEKRLGNYNDAEGLLLRAYQSWPHSTLTATALADVYELRGNVFDARDIFRKCEKKAEEVGDAGFFQVRQRLLLLS